MINFPADPQVNDIFTDWLWDGAKWVNAALGGRLTVVVQTAAPMNPALGLLWFDPAIGRLFVWFDDGNSQQWVEVSPPVGGSP